MQTATGARGAPGLLVRETIVFFGYEKIFLLAYTCAYTQRTPAQLAMDAVCSAVLIWRTT
jgi:hypothetical protein